MVQVLLKRQQKLPLDLSKRQINWGNSSLFVAFLENLNCKSQNLFSISTYTFKKNYWNNYSSTCKPNLKIYSNHLRFSNIILEIKLKFKSNQTFLIKSFDKNLNNSEYRRNSWLCQKLLKKSLKTNLAKIAASLLSTLWDFLPAKT